MKIRYEYSTGNKWNDRIFSTTHAKMVDSGVKDLDKVTGFQAIDGGYEVYYLDTKGNNKTWFDKRDY